MVLTNKVLTVSYGTFSCTLEGFDDSFGTMKAIAEYFRDLAADDRYFGAEPPQPDVDMLARIAQREVSRRVEARRDGAGIVLRAADEPTDMPASDATIAEPMPETMPETMSDVVPEQSGANAEIVEDAPETKARAVPETIDMTPVDTIPAEPESEPAAEIMPEPVAEAMPESTPEPALPPDSIAAKLQRIRAVVSRAADAGEETDFSEDEHADPFLTTAPLDMAQTQPHDQGDADISGDAREIQDSYEEEFEEETAEGDDLSLTLADLGSLEDTVPDEASEPANSPAAADQGEGFNTLEAGNEALPGESLLDEDAEDEEPQTGDVTDEDKDAEDTIFADLDEPEPEPEEAAESDIENILRPDAEPDATPSDSPVRARVVKVRRADLEAAISSGTLEEIGAQPASGSSLSDEAEADLMRELAEVEAELGVGNAVDDAQEAQPATGQQRDQVGTVDDVSRLMEEVDHKMGEPESATRRETYSHLRAAVAATKADRAFTGEVPQLTHDQAFRDDLANVVRPRRPSTSGASGQRPMGDRQAPLKLVAEQRVDDAAADARRGPVRPRRVSPADAETALSGDMVGTPGGFAVFAREAGATGLSELLEAAAAYLSYVEGRDQFSRPQLMTKVRQVEQEDFNREDGLRSFGQLLREGKIRKTKGGRFTASEDIGFKPAQRAAG